MLAHKGRKVSTAQQFIKVQKVVKSKLKTLKQAGKGNLPNKASPLSEDEIEKLWTCGQLGMDNPRSIINTLWWFNTLHFGMRSVTPPRQMCWCDVQLNTDCTGQRFLTFNERATKTRTGANVKRDAHENAMAFANTENPGRCPMELYLKYASMRPESARSPDSPFYLACNTRPGGPKEGEMWFKNQPMGINTIGTIMKNMAAAAQLGDSIRISNHTARKTMIQKLSDSNIEPTKIMQISGHRNVQSINNYATMSHSQHRNICNILNSTRAQSSTSTISQPVEKPHASRESHDQPASFPNRPTQLSAVQFHAPVYEGVFNFIINWDKKTKELGLKRLTVFFSVYLLTAFNFLFRTLSSLNHDRTAAAGLSFVYIGD